MRAHEGVAYYYTSLGNFVPYEEVLPQHVFAYVNGFLLFSEGAFTGMTGQVTRTNKRRVGCVSNTVCTATIPPSSPVLRTHQTPEGRSANFRVRGFFPLLFFLILIFFEEMFFFIF